MELENIRGETIRGHQIRSRIQWLGDGEKPSKYFCSLERHNYTDKTIKKIIKHDGTFLVDQNDIMFELKNLYSNLFKSFDHQLEDIDLNQLLAGYQVNTLSAEQSRSLDGPLTYKEISLTVKQMKNNKTPGIDGFPAEFFKTILEKC